MTWGSLFEKIIGRFSLVGDRPFHDDRRFPWVKEVESYYPQIHAELMRVLEQKRIPNFQDISHEQRVITNDDKWKTFFFYVYGERNDENCRFCPHTCWALSRIPGMTTAFFSILEPGKIIPAHRGPYKGVLRYHLCLEGPDSLSAAIWVGSPRCIRPWHSGQSMIFDDTFMHSAWNMSTQRRVVLFVDFLRPLPFPLNFLNRAVVRRIRSTDFVQAGATRLKEWNARQ